MRKVAGLQLPTLCYGTQWINENLYTKTRKKRNFRKEALPHIASIANNRFSFPPKTAILRVYVPSSPI